MVAFSLGLRAIATFVVLCRSCLHVLVHVCALVLRVHMSACQTKFKAMLSRLQATLARQLYSTVSIKMLEELMSR